MAKNVTQAELKKLLGSFGLILTILLLAGAGLAYWGSSFAKDQVSSQLGQEKITFPAAGTAALDPKEFPGLQQYAGQAVDSGVKAKAFANEFIWVHMMKASGGKTYAEISAAAMANPTDQKLAGLKNTLFQGDTLRTSLLMAYAFSMIGVVAGYTAITLLIGAGLVLLFSLGALAGSRRA